VALLGVSALFAQGKDDDDAALPDHSLKEWTLGTMIMGDEIKTEDLEGKVVALEYWGIR
jgi:hypothetical protein